MLRSTARGSRAGSLYTNRKKLVLCYAETNVLARFAAVGECRGETFFARLQVAVHVLQVGVVGQMFLNTLHVVVPALQLLHEHAQLVRKLVFVQFGGLSAPAKRSGDPMRRWARRWTRGQPWGCGSFQI